MSGFSVFDDVAFYYLMQAVITVFLVPWTLVKVISYCWETLQHSRAKDKDFFSASNHEYELQGTKIVDKKSWYRRYVTPKNIIFVALWAFFLYQCSLLPTYLDKNLASWDPVNILGVPADASVDDIKKAYKELSLKWHPDKHPADMKEEAQAKFIEILRAYKALTDPKAMANMRDFGNIDGHQGVNMTIGLPSFLTNEENSLKTLLVYFLVMIVLPPVCVFMWWRKAAGVHESGISRETITNYWHLVGEHMGPKFLLAVMCSAAEFKLIGTRDHSSEKEADRKKLKLEVQEYMVKTHASKLEYVDRAHVLTLAYLLRVPIPDSLQGELALILQDAHRLLGALFQICLARKFVKATMGCIELMQMITQAMAPNSSPLLQVPFLTSKEIRLAAKKKMDTLEAFRAADDEKRMKVYPGHTEAEWKRIKEVCDRIPDLALECQSSVDGEEGIFEGDLVTIRVTLERIKPGVTRKTQSRKITTQVDGDGETTSEATEDKEDVDDSVVSDLPKTTDEEEDAKVVDLRERRLLNSLPVAKAPPSKFGKDDQQVAVHSAFFPYPKVEKWVLLLFQKNKNKTLSLLAIQKVPDFREKEVVELRMRVGEKGVWPYELHAKCDSYVGCDVSLNFKITVNKLSKADEDRRDEKFAQSKVMGLDDDEDAPEKAYEGKWYYAGFASFWELAMNLAVLLVMFFFVMNFLQQRGYWQLYVDPLIAKGFKFVAPVYNAVAPTLKPVVGPILSAIETALIAIGNMTTVDPEQLMKVKQSL